MKLTVAQLIEELKKYDQSLVVACWQAYDDCPSTNIDIRVSSVDNDEGDKNSEIKTLLITA